MTDALVPMAGVANRLAVHYDTFRKGWRAWVRDLGFPAPVALRPYRWNPASLDSWEARREALNRAGIVRDLTPATAPDAPANDVVADEPRIARRPDDRQRDALLRMMAGDRPAQMGGH
jgi:hypothetical protein